jgi:hypothetical protein
VVSTTPKPEPGLAVRDSDVELDGR